MPTMGLSLQLTRRLVINIIWIFIFLVHGQQRDTRDDNKQPTSVTRMRSVMLLSLTSFTESRFCCLSLTRTSPIDKDIKASQSNSLTWFAAFWTPKRTSRLRWTQVKWKNLNEKGDIHIKTIWPSILLVSDRVFLPWHFRFWDHVRQHRLYVCFGFESLAHAHGGKLWNRKFSN